MGYALSFALVTIRHKISVFVLELHIRMNSIVFQFCLEHLQPIHGHEDSGEIAEEASNELVENTARLDLEGRRENNGATQVSTEHGPFRALSPLSKEAWVLVSGFGVFWSHISILRVYRGYISITHGFRHVCAELHKFCVFFFGLGVWVCFHLYSGT
ncbi:uncharacterized protein LOC130757533 [Actinidia eriantha]|uniref:uncharacterized protein LOC130757533 n=1 Tax=Actinidia eriantha TaxID=165200 RepID=UPI0025885BD3|nr:uncharacterized protein LOC130757533 [Actinidia eriantha]